jgi:hypothetical protein
VKLVRISGIRVAVIAVITWLLKWARANSGRIEPAKGRQKAAIFLGQNRVVPATTSME